MALEERPTEITQPEITATDPERPQQQDYKMPHVITVHIQRGDNSIESIAVEVEKSTRIKPFIGGYRHTMTGAEFHHAAVQTIPKKRPDKEIEEFCRDTQTLVIQTHTRRWLATRYVQQLRKQKMLYLEWVEQEALRRKLEKENRMKRDFERRMNPKTKEDFELVFSTLEQWRQEEMDRINATLTGTDRKAALCVLLEQESQIIACIGRHKLTAGDENVKKSVKAFLEKCAAIKKWKRFDGKIVEMDTPDTIRARELKDLYASVNMTSLTQEERLDVLLILKHTVQEHDCKLTQEIVELIDREEDLLTRGVKKASLEGLRQRISTLFLQYIKTPLFNPEVIRLLKVPQDPLTLQKNIYLCSGCNRYLTSSEFKITTRSSAIGRCQHCYLLENEAHHREDYSEYRDMLKHLRQTEADYPVKGKIACLIQEKDLQYLLEAIWGVQSALSAWDELSELVLVRWNKYVEWSPWNCILLTKDEAKAHFKLKDVEKIVSSIKKIFEELGATAKAPLKLVEEYLRCFGRELFQTMNSAVQVGQTGTVQNKGTQSEEASLFIHISCQVTLCPTSDKGVMTECTVEGSDKQLGSADFQVISTLETLAPVICKSKGVQTVRGLSFTHRETQTVIKPQIKEGIPRKSRDLLTVRHVELNALVLQRDALHEGGEPIHLLPNPQSTNVRSSVWQHQAYTYEGHITTEDELKDVLQPLFKQNNRNIVLFLQDQVQSNGMKAAYYLLGLLE
ncbi:IQUB protein, partial [Polypterus senegalus]